MLDFKNLQAAISWVTFSGLKIVFIFVVAFVLSKLARKFIVKTLKKTVRINGELLQVDEKRQKTLLRIFSSVLSSLIWAGALFMVLPEVGINVSALLAGVGVIGLALGMGARQLIQDYLNGIFIILEDQYRVGDEVSVAGLEGKVLDINLRRTVLKDKEGTIHFIPHSQERTVSRKTRQQNS